MCQKARQSGHRPPPSPIQLPLLDPLSGPDITSLLPIWQKTLIVNHPAGASAVSEVCITLLLFSTIPVTVATPEHSFSELKLIKNHLRITVGQETLSGLTMLSTEHDRAENLDTWCIVDDFAERQARCMPFK